MSEAIVHHYGRDELLRRLAHPFWFQSFGAVMGMDWHSSGVTTSVIGALKRGLTLLSDELGIHVCGGRGFRGSSSQSGNGWDFPAGSSPRWTAHGFELYLHGFVVANDGQWVVIQQGMNGVRKQARRYHWLSEGLKSFVEEPALRHWKSRTPPLMESGKIINLTDRRAEASRRSQLGVLQSLDPDGMAAYQCGRWIWRNKNECKD
jgi:uncharacterized protein